MSEANELLKNRIDDVKAAINKRIEFKEEHQIKIKEYDEEIKELMQRKQDLEIALEKLGGKDEN